MFNGLLLICSCGAINFLIDIHDINNVSKV